MIGGETQERGPEGPLNWRTFLLALGLHLAAFVFFWIAALVIHRTPDVIIPIDMTVVPPWAEEKPDDPEPDPNPPPPPKPEPPKPKPEPKPAPKPDPVPEKVPDAVVKEPEKPKPKPKFTKGKLVTKPEKKHEKKAPEKPDFRKNAKLIKNPPKNVTRYGKATAHDKPMDPREFEKALASGARIGATNQLAANEEQRCVSLIAAALKRHWTEDFNWTESTQSVHLLIQLGPGGVLRGWRIIRSSGDPQVDRSVLAAAKTTGSVPGLTAAFLSKYPEITIEMKPVRE